MPNGGSDCCGTCWFNRKNQGERDWLLYVDTSVPSHCEIRDIAIKDPFYTYCANHPHRRPDRDPIPIGPVMRHGGWEEEWRVRAGQPDVLVSKENPRYFWKPSPDSEEIRQHLLNLLESIFEHMSRDWYPIGDGLGETVLRQLGEFREQRAVRHLEWICENLEGSLNLMADAAREALARIRGDE
ncbi:MAG: hypothetical protein OXH06_20125 [Gemmatimonadetes bacterium]|nr:hypothetical protein [Gemmatimonadota bacterium]